jgi:hypothetical protein
VVSTRYDRVEEHSGRPSLELPKEKRKKKKKKKEKKKRSSLVIIDPFISLSIGIF